jgi:hypothetical protein
MQLAGAAKGDGSLRIIQVNFNHILKLTSSFYPLRIFYLLIRVWCSTIAERHHSDDQRASQCRVDCWTQPLLRGLYCKHQHPFAVVVIKAPFFFSVC